jgi:anti-sigma factor RsiW
VTAWACCRARRRLVAFVAGELPAARARAVRQHLFRCVACRRLAASHQQAGQALRHAGAAIVASGRYEAIADTMFERIVARAAGSPPGGAGLPTTAAWSTRLAWAAAAALLVVLGGLWGTGSASSSVWRRAPIAAQVAERESDGSAIVVPWSGPRVVLQPVGLDAVPPDGGAGTGGTGMMGRDRLRAVVDEAIVLPARGR